MLILRIDLLKKIGGKKGKLLRFLHRVGARTEQGQGTGALSLFYMNHYSFLKTHKLKITVSFSLFWW